MSVTDGTVDEKGLSNGSASAGSSETTTGSFTIATGNDTLGSLEVKNASGIWVNVTSATTGSPVTVAGANGVLTVTSDGAGHYSWSYTLTQNLLSHDDTVVDGDGDRGAADQKPGEAFLVRATDHEGDVSSDPTR
ncbi:MAG: hypothetical protein MZV49_12410 [Rhodopseudomonas palustris]|nr:hypothetical protein [Rhodopseudomonas palustris]